MTKSKARLVPVLAAVFVLAVASLAFAIDPPHDSGKGVSCINCHNPSINLTQPGIDNTPTNVICRNCHKSGGAAQDVVTHSSNETTATYGAWTRECHTCHNPHSQEQSRITANKAAYPSGAWLYTDTIAASTANTITVSGTPWSPDQWINYVVQLRIPSDYYYYIIDNTENTLVTSSDMIAFTRRAGNSFAIVYGQLLRGEINTGSRITNSSGVTFDTNTFRDATFLNSSGPLSAVTTGQDTDSETQAICVICHTKTSHMNIGIAKFGDSFDDKPNYAHYYSDTQACWNASCHSGHDGGFSAGCTDCHGYPPVDDSTVLTTSAPKGPTGRTDDFPGTAAGEHDLHVNTKGYACTTCHNGGSPSGSHNADPALINIGFNIFGTLGGDYSAPAFSNANYTHQDDGTTVVTVGGTTRDCTSIYCHSSGQGATAGDATPYMYGNPDWDVTASGACGTCHYVDEGSGLTTGSHAEHLGTTGVNGCGDCHTGAANDASSYSSAEHVDNTIDVANTYSAAGSPGNGYGTCTAAACHDDGTGALVTTPTWGTSVTDCSECHATQPSTGSHTAHLGSTGVACGNCHDGTVEGTTEPTTHLDTDIDVFDSAEGDLGYPANKTKNTAYAACTTAACHDDGTGALVTTPTWGTSVADCSECHATQPSTGSHTAHLGSSMGLTVACGDCHDGTVEGTTEPTTHLDADIDVFDSAEGDLGYPANKTKNTAYAACTTAACHDDGTGALVTTPTWGDATAACTECHASAPATNGHTTHLGLTGVACADCHDGAVQDTTAPTTHLDDDIDVFDVSEGDLGYPANKTKNTAVSNCSNMNCHGTTSFTWDESHSTSDACTICHGTEQVSTADGSSAEHLMAPDVDTAGDSAASDEQVGAHQEHLNSPLYMASIACTECHDKPSDPMDAGHFDAGPAFDGQADLTFNGPFGILQGTTPTYDYATNTCSAVYCHGGAMPKGSNNGSDTAPVWNATAYLSGTPSDNDDGTGDCEKCHGAPPNVSHGGSETLSQCKDCHPETVLDTAGLINTVTHIDGVLQASGACNACHGYPPYQGDGKDSLDGIGEGKGAHLAHVGNIMNEPGYTYGALDPDNDSFGDAKVTYVCGACHSMTGSDHNSGTRVINFDGSNKYRFMSSGSPTYNGEPGTSSSTTLKSCSNVSCHFTESPGWQDPATAGP